MKRSFIFLVALVLLAVAGWYGYKVLYGKVKPLTEVRAEVTISADTLIAAFEKDSAAANKQYLGKILAVQGHVKSVEGEGAAKTVILGNAAALSSVRCSMDSVYSAAVNNIATGTVVTIKGACTGYNADDMGLGADVVLNRCVLETNK